MPPFLLPFALIYALYKELWGMFKRPKYRALLLWVAIILLTGTIFYNRIEGWGWVDSFYFSVITLTTVGYGDLSPTTPVSKLFTVFYIFFGLSILLAFLTQLAKERMEIYESRVNKKYDSGQDVGLNDNDTTKD